MRNLIVFFSLISIALNVHAQTFDCASWLTSRKASPSFNYNNLSKSFFCSTKKKYTYNFALEPGKEYRISFYASPVFNNKMFFEIIDTKTGKKLIDLPGETENPKKDSCVLREYWDRVSEKSIYPYFDFEPEETLNLKVIINIPEYKFKVKIADADIDLKTEAVFEERTEKHNGCVILYIQDRVLN